MLGISRTSTSFALVSLSLCLFACDSGQSVSTDPSTSHIAASEISATTTPLAEERPRTVPAIDNSDSTRYLFDVHGHSEDELAGLLGRAKEIWQQTPLEQRDHLLVAMVLHGPDVKFFSNNHQNSSDMLIDMAAKLDAFGFMDFKVCAASARAHGIDKTEFPAFIEVVPYGPSEVSELRKQGFVEL